MRCEEVKINLPEYIDGKLDTGSAEAVRRHLTECGSCKALYSELNSFLTFTGSLPEPEPPMGMKEEFLRMTEAEFGKRRKTVVMFPVWARIAAMVLIVFGTFAAGYFTGSDGSDVRQMRAEVSRLRQDVIMANLSQMSGPQKIQAVYSTTALSQPGDNLVDALVNTMNSDNNVNVRLAAINALSEMMDKNSRIKNELINSLSVQENPLLQISLIQVLTQSGIKEARKQIETISEDEKTDAQVKEFAKDMIKTII